MPLTRPKPILNFKANALDLIENGYSPIPINAKTKRPAINKWEQFCERQPTKAEIEKWDKDFPGCGIGVCCGFGEVIAFDIDTDEPEVAAAVLRLVPGPHIKKVGKRGFTVFARGKLRNEKIKLAAGQVEVLAKGRQTVLPPSIHPDTDEPYFWLTCECGCSYPTYNDEEVGPIPLDTLYWLPADDLPELPDDFRNQLVQELSPWLEAEKQPSEPASPYSPYPQVCVSADPRRPKVAAGLLKRLVQEVASAKVGERNETLLRCAGQLFVQVRHELLNGEEVMAALEKAFKLNRIKGDDPKEFEATLLKAWVWSEGKALPDLRDRPISKVERGQAADKAQASFDVDNLPLTDDQRKWIAEGLPTTEGPISFVRGVVGKVGPHIARALLTNPAHRISDELNGLGEKWLDAQIAEARKSVESKPIGKSEPSGALDVDARALLAVEAARLSEVKTKSPQLSKSMKKLAPYVQRGAIKRGEVDAAFQEACGEKWRDRFQDVLDSTFAASKGADLPRVKGTAGSRIKNLLDALKLSARFNVFSYRTEVEWENGAGQLNEEMLLLIWQRAEELGFEIKKVDLQDHIKAVGLKNPVHPVRDYLEGAQWDGVARVAGLFSRYAGAEDTPLNRAIAVLFMVAAVRRILQPGVHFKYMPILFGRQDLGKSRFWRLLGGDEWFDDNLSFEHEGRVLVEITEGKWIVEISELGGLTNREVEKVKAQMARTADRASRKYEKDATDRPRQFVQVGTTNDVAPFRDQTGNVRFLPVEVGVTGGIDFEGLEADRDQLWAEAVVLERTYDWLMLPKDVLEDVKSEQERRTVKDPIIEWLEDQLGGRFGKVSKASIWATLGVEPSKRTGQLGKTIKATMLKLGWVECRLSHGELRPTGYKKVKPEVTVEKGELAGITIANETWLYVWELKDGTRRFAEAEQDDDEKISLAVSGGVDKPYDSRRQGS